MGKASRSKRRDWFDTRDDGTVAIICPDHGELGHRARSMPMAVLSAAHHLKLCHGPRPIIRHPGGVK